MNTKGDLYFNREGFPILRKSVIVAADILGYKKIIANAFQTKSEHEILQILHEILNYEFRNLDDPSHKKWILKIHSDNLLLVCPLIGESQGEFEFAQACFCVAHYQLGMATRGYLIRGGVGVGDIHVSDRLVFGNIMVEISDADTSGHPPYVRLMESAEKFFSNLTHRSIYGKF